MDESPEVEAEAPPLEPQRPSWPANNDPDTPADDAAFIAHHDRLQEAEAEAAKAPPAPEGPPQKAKKPKAPKEQCPLCLRWYAATRVQPGRHKCVPPVRAPDLQEPCKDHVSEEPPAPSPEPPEPPEPPPEPGPASRQLTLVRPDDLPTHEQVAKWVSFERESKRDRKRARWEAQMFS